MNPELPNPLRQAVHWLATHTGFPARRLAPGAEVMLCAAALVEAEEAGARPRFLLQRRDPAQTSALRARGLSRSQVHYKCDNSAKV